MAARPITISFGPSAKHEALCALGVTETNQLEVRRLEQVVRFMGRAGGIEARAMSLVVAVAVLIACPGGMTDYRRDLTHGYKLVRANADEYVIVDSAELVVVTPTISEIRRVGDLIVGITQLPQRQGNFGSKPGYFVVNTATGESRMGLSKEAWLAELQRYGIDDQPTLRRPSRSGEL